MPINPSFMQPNTPNSLKPILQKPQTPQNPQAPMNFNVPVNNRTSTMPVAPSGTRDVFGNLPDTQANPLGVRAASPFGNVEKPANTVPSSMQAPKNDFQTQLDNIKQTALGIQSQLQNQPQAPQTPQQQNQGYGVNQGLYGQLITGLANAPQNNQDVAQARANLQNLQNEYAQQTGNIEANRGGLSLQSGQEGILNRLYATKEAAAQQALGSALTSQQLQQQALGQAAGLAAPQPYGITTTPYNPATGTFGTLPGGNAGAFGAGVVSGNVSLGEQFSQLNSANNQAKGYEDTINNYLQQNPQLNPSDLTAVNGVVQWLKGQVGDPKYQTLANYITEYANTLAPILGAGGSITDFKNSLAQSLVNGAASGQSIREVMANISKAADDKLANLRSSGMGGGQVAGGSPGYQSNNQQGGNTFGGFFGQ